MITSKKHTHSRQSNQQGFTIIESLVAILVVTILLVAIAPVIVLSVATRVQARRVDIATDAARSYIDTLRSGAIDAPPISTILSENVPAPIAPTGCNSNDYCVTPTSSPATPPQFGVFCIDGDQNGSCGNDFKDMLVQAIGYHPTPESDPLETVKQGYQLSIRVYRADATENLDATGDLQTPFTGGIGINLRSQLPLVEMQTEIIPDSATYENLCLRLGCGNTLPSP